MVVNPNEPVPALITLASQVSKVGEEVLLEAEREWGKSREEYRDACIRVGGLIRKFILDRLSEGDNIPVYKRQDMGLTHTASVAIASDRLGITPAKLLKMVRVSILVELFGDPGSLCYASLLPFTAFIRRKRAKVARGRTKKEDEILPSESEQWEIKDTKGRNPLEVYRQAIEEKWSTRDIYDACKSIQTQRMGKAKNYATGKVDTRKREKPSTDLYDDEISGPGGVDTTQGKRLPRLSTIATNADPRDLADMILEMIAACPRMQELKQILLEKM